MDDLCEPTLRAELLGPNGPYADLRVVASTGSTNADLAAAAGDGAPDKTALIADEQTAGRGRLARTWTSPKGAGLYLSVLLRPADVPTAARGSLTMVAGLALVDVAERLGVPNAQVKWPNDLLIDGGKAAGVLAESAGEAVVVGIGLNVHAMGAVEPGPGALPATSLAEHMASEPDRTSVAVDLLRALATRENVWRAAGGRLPAPVREEYKGRCASIGAGVKVLLPDGTELDGTGIDVDADGMLVVDTATGRTSVAAGDVVHVR